MYFALQSLLIRNSHFQSQMYQILQMQNHPQYLYVEEEDGYEVAGDWEDQLYSHSIW